jgi:hypothetical protein
MPNKRLTNDSKEQHEYKHARWVKNLPAKPTSTFHAPAMQIEKIRIDELENAHVFSAPDVLRAGGLAVLKVLGEPKDIVIETIRRLLAA